MTQKYIASPQIVKRVWPVSHAHGLSFFLSHPMVFFLPHSPFGQLFIKNKKKPRHAGKTKAAEGRRVTGVSEVGKQDRGGRFHLGISPNFGPQFLRRNRIWTLPVAQYISADQKDRWLSTVACNPSPQNRAVQTHFFDSSFWFCLIHIVNLTVWKHVPGRETWGQYGTSAENRAENGRKQNKG